MENRKYRCYNPLPAITPPGGCVIGAQNEASPVSDYRGHSVNTTKETTFYCEVTSSKQVGCNDEQTVNSEGGITYSNSDQYETIDNSAMFAGALQGTQLSDQMMHIWSGWHGECENGVFTDFSWTQDPMTIASLAMSAYGSANASADAATKTSTEAAAKGAKEVKDAEGVVTATTATVNGTTVVATGATAAEQAASLINQGATMADLAKMSGDVGRFAAAAEKASYWADSLGNTLVGLVGSTSADVAKGFTDLASSASKTVGDMATGVSTNPYVADLVANYNTAVDYTTTVYKNTIGIADTTKDLNALLDNLNEAQSIVIASGDLEALASVNKMIADTTTQLDTLATTLAGKTLDTVTNTKATIASFFTNPATVDTAKAVAANAAITGESCATVQTVKDFFANFYAYNEATTIGFNTINWTQIAQAGLTMYSNVAASKDDMVKAWKAQQAYVMNGDGTANDVVSNAYASCMASVGANFVNTVSIAGGARDSSVTSQELLTPWKNPMRISLQSLYELRSIVGDSFMQISYRVMDIDYNMQMVTIIALNAPAYSQLTQEVCGGYTVAVLSNAMNQQASKPSMLDGLMGMSAQDAAMMAASMACSLAGPYAFACSLGMKLLSSVSSGNACEDEKIAQSQKPIQLKTNKFQKFGQCHHVGTSCSKKQALLCIRKREDYCCYDQISTRIFVEGVKQERGSDWGSCNDLTMNDLKNISFTPCSDTQDPFLDKCFPIDKYRELAGELKKMIKKGFAVDSETFISQVQNAMEVSQ